MAPAAVMSDQDVKWRTDATPFIKFKNARGFVMLQYHGIDGVRVADAGPGATISIAGDDHHVMHTPDEVMALIDLAHKIKMKDGGSHPKPRARRSYTTDEVRAGLHNRKIIVTLNEE